MEGSLPLIVAAMIALVLICLALAGGMVYLAYTCRSLKRECSALAEKLASQDGDLIGLCAAAVQVDRRVLEQEQQLRECRERLEGLKAQEQEAQPYQTAIEKVKRGAGPDDLIAEFGLSRSEANLLSNLYGERRR